MFSKWIIYYNKCNLQKSLKKNVQMFYTISKTTE